MDATKRAAITLALVAGLMAVPVAAFASKGADDPAGHNQGDDHGGGRARVTLVHNSKGSDDPAGDDHGGKGNDDPAGDDHGGGR